MLSGIVKLCFSYSVRLLWRCRCQCRYHSIPCHFSFMLWYFIPYSFAWLHISCTAKIENYDWNQWWECPWGNNTHHIFVDIFFRRLLLISFCQPNNPISHNSHARAAHTQTMYSTYTHWQIRNGGNHFYLHSISAIQTVCTDFMHSQTILLKSPEWNSTMANTPRMCANQ